MRAQRMHPNNRLVRTPETVREFPVTFLAGAAQPELHGLPQVKPPLSLRVQDTDCGSTFGLCVSSVALAMMMLRVE